jgi:hypothetical protein
VPTILERYARFQPSQNASDTSKLNQIIEIWIDSEMILLGKYLFLDRLDFVHLYFINRRDYYVRIIYNL